MDLSDCTNFMLAVLKANMKNSEYVYILPWLSHYATLVYMSLYDALFLYGLALRDAYDITGDEGICRNGSLIWKKMTNRQFLGMTGQILIDNEAFRIPSYTTYQMYNGSLRVVVELEAKLGDPEKCNLKNKECSLHVPHEILSNYWLTLNGELPLDMPFCGYDGSLCDYTKYILTGASTILLLFVITIGYFIYLKELVELFFN
ncbi:unnamed protein product [Onchocerca flexuosa]|uniref:ANF_receptor domain-containing protein n=1 Tax=Onchocerca flexuosa TaxID=387005 RepID=A0A183I554_9BILA|nr:unnamed protein product [Onchocerca flexuosa]